MTFLDNKEEKNNNKPCQAKRMNCTIGEQKVGDYSTHSPSDAISHGHQT